MGNLDSVAFAILAVAFLIVTLIGFVSARWRPAEDPMHLNEWGLGGRGFGTFISWFLLGGDLYTAYTFIAVPAAQLMPVPGPGRGVIVAGRSAVRR